MKPVIIKAGKEASFKLTFVGREPMKIQWYNDGEELMEESNIKIEKSSSHSRLLLTKCQRRTTGEIKIKIKNECGTTEAIRKLIVLGKVCHHILKKNMLLTLHSTNIRSIWSIS